jgi:hypothetical protein
LTDDIDEIKYFADKEADSIEIVSVQVGDEIVDKQFYPFPLSFFSNNGTAKIKDECIYLSTFPSLTCKRIMYMIRYHDSASIYLPQVVRKIE